jgi:hypothetical protein
MKMNENVKALGVVSGEIEYKNGEKLFFEYKNTVLSKGRQALAASLANKFTGDYNFYISRMLFGDGGTIDGAKKNVNTNRNGLFGVTRASKPVISHVDSNMPNQVTFTSVLGFNEANGYALNEMSLQMSTGDLYSMVTFPDLNKTSEMQITFNWRLSFV